MKLQNIGIFFLLIILVGCNKPTTPKSTLKSYTVQPSVLHKSLHFSGTIQPIREMALIAPMDATIESMNYQYGDVIKKGEIVFILNSSELQRQYNDLLIEYLKTKDSYDLARAHFMSLQKLWHAGLVPKNDYISEKSNFRATQIALLEISLRLSELLESMNQKTLKNPSALSFVQFEDIHRALATKHNLIHLKSPSDGIFLYASRNNENLKINTGSHIKSGQVLGLITDLSGIRIEINISEMDVSKIKPGMQALITGTAFGRHVLKGKLVSANVQALQTQDGLPSFTAIIEVPVLNKKQQSWIKIGMSAEVELMLDRQNKLMVPTEAIQSHNGKNQVNLLLNGKMTPHTVKLGMVDKRRVVIESGLKIGDIVMYE